MSLASLDILLFYVFFEAMLIPMYFLIGGFGRHEIQSRREIPAVQPLPADSSCWPPSSASTS